MRDKLSSTGERVAKKRKKTERMPKQLSALERAKPKSAKILNACAVAPPLTRLSAVGMIHNTNPINAPADHVLHRHASEPPAESRPLSIPGAPNSYAGKEIDHIN